MKITKSQLKQIIKEELEAALRGITYGPEGDEGHMRGLVKSYYDVPTLDPEKASELADVFTDEEEVELTDRIGPEEVRKRAIEIAAQVAIDSGYNEWPEPEDFIDQAKKELTRELFKR